MIVIIQGYNNNLVGKEKIGITSRQDIAFAVVDCLFGHQQRHEFIRLVFACDQMGKLGL